MFLLSFFFEAFRQQDSPSHHYFGTVCVFVSLVLVDIVMYM